MNKSENFQSASHWNFHVLTLFFFSPSHLHSQPQDDTTLPANSTPGSYDSPIFQWLLHTSWHSHFLPAHPNIEREWEVEIHSSLRKHQMVWKHRPKAQSLKGLYWLTVCFYFLPCVIRPYYHFHHLLWQDWFYRSTPVLRMSCQLVNSTVISCFTWPLMNSAPQYMQGVQSACAANRSLGWFLNTALMIAPHCGSVQWQVDIF